MSIEVNIFVFKEDLIVGKENFYSFNIICKYCWKFV